MKVERSSDRSRLLTVYPDKGQSRSLRLVSEYDIKNEFMTFGAILFRGFDTDVDDFECFTNLFCSNAIRYPDERRDFVSADGKIQTVDRGFYDIPLHSELSHTPFQPDICWFYCDTPDSSVGGQTLVCDGSKVVESLSVSTRDKLIRSELLYRMKIPCHVWSKFIGTASSEVMANYIEGEGYSEHYSFVGEDLIQNYVAPFLTKPNTSDSLAFANNVIHNSVKGRVLTYPVYVDGTPIQNEIIDELKLVSDKHIEELSWRKGDLVMVDNTRFLHGRRKILDSARKLYTKFTDMSF